MGRAAAAGVAAAFGFLCPFGAAPAEGQAATIPDIVEVTDISGLAASPDGTSVAFRTERASLDRNSYILTWQVADLTAGTVRVAGGGGEPLYRDPGLLATENAFWSPDSRSFFYRALIDGRIGIWLAAAEGTGAKAVAVGDADVEQVEPAPGGGALLYRLGPTRDEIRRAEQREYDDGILVDAYVDLAQNLFRGGAINGRMATQRLTGRWFERTDLLSQEKRRVRRLDLATLADSDAAPPEAASASAALPQLPLATARSTGGDVAAASWNGTQGALVVVRSERRGEISCTAAACASSRILALVWRPGSDDLLVTTEDRAHAQTLSLWSPSSGRFRTVYRSDGLINGGREATSPCALTQAAAFCVAASALSPPELVRIDLATGARSTVFDPNAELRLRIAAQAEHLAWTAPDGQTFSGVLLSPRGAPAARRPLFLTFYRCEGFLRGGLGDEWPLQPLVSAGFAAACINAAPIVGHYDPIVTYQHALGAINAFVDLLDRRGLIDRSKIAMGGLSFGSEVTMWTAIHSDLLAAASISSPQPEASYYWFNAVRGRDQPARIRDAWGLGPPDETPEAWRRFAPALNTARIRAPLLLQVPEQEARYFIELYARLTNSTTPAELYAYPDEAHIKLQPRHKRAVYQRNLDWFRFWLQGHVDPDPAKAEQYARWRALAQRRSGAQTQPGHDQVGPPRVGQSQETMPPNPQAGHERSQSSMAASSSSRK